MNRHIFSFALFALLGCPGGDDSNKDTGGAVSETGDTAGGDEDGDGYKPSENDCNDNDSTVNPGVAEICDGIDNNCDGQIDEGQMGTFYADADGDGFGDVGASMEACEAPDGYVENADDCDDANDAKFPDNPETCDGLDNNCDGNIDEGVGTTYYADGDLDTYGDPDSAVVACEPPEGMVLDATDCDDTSNKAYPGNTEVCDEIDNNCDGRVDEGVQTTYYADVDGDTYGDAGSTTLACSVPTGYSADSTDCNDTEAAVNPAATELCNGIDDNCDGVTDDDAADRATWYVDADSDTYGDASVSVLSCSQPAGYVADSSDCNDTTNTAYPGATEYCDGIDNNCDGVTDEDTAVDASTWYADADSDSYGDASVSDVECYQPTGYVGDNTDCNDTTAAANPAQLEVCDGIDNNCDGAVDEDTAIDATTWYADSDSDTYGDINVTDVECYQPTGYVADNTDCDDTRASDYPGAIEYCDGYDNNCDGTVDEDTAIDAAIWYADSDSDTYGNPAVSDTECYQPTGYVADSTDCDDTRFETNPGATEFCNSIDDDCNGTIDDNYASDALTWYVDADSDTYGDASVSTNSCSQPAGYVADNTDCNDTTAAAYPGADEICDLIDNDCDGDIDEDGGVSDGNTFYADADGDTYGDAGSTLDACDLPSGYVENYYDCNDGDTSEPIVVSTSGSSAGVGSASDPVDSIQGGINLADECVIVEAGTYAESTIDFGSDSLDVWGVDGSSATIVDPGLSTCNYSNPTDCEPVFYIASGSAAAPVIHGFTVRGGTGYVTSSTTTETCADSSSSHSGTSTCTVTNYDYCGGGAYINGDDPQFSDVVFDDNDLPDFDQVSTGDFTQVWLASAGGAVCAVNSAATFDEVVFTDNHADVGGGVYGTSNAALDFAHAWWDDNSASDGAALATESASATVTNSVVACNDATVDGGGFFSETSGTVTVTNATFAMNTSGTSSSNGSAGYVGSGTTATLWNLVVQGNTTSPLLQNAGTGTIAYADIYNAGSGGGTGGTWSSSSTTTIGSQYTSITCDGNYLNDDATLASGATGINTGDPDSAYNDADGSRNDLGAYGGPEGTW